MPVADSDPRLVGIIEQYERAKLFLHEAQSHSEPRERLRRLMAATYFARAIVEIMLESADMEVVKISRDDLERRLIARLPGYLLLEKIRIHDFHRFGVLPRHGFFMGGLVRLRAQAGHAAMTFGPDGPEASTSGSSKVIEQRALHMAGDKVFDEAAGTYVTIDEVLARYPRGGPQRDRRIPVVVGTGRRATGAKLGHRGHAPAVAERARWASGSMKAGTAKAL